MSLLITDTTLLGGLPLPSTAGRRELRLIPSDNRARWCFDLGNQAMKDGFWALARGCYFTCISRYGEQLAVRYNLALCELATGRPGQAMEHLAKAQQLGPDDNDVMERLIELAAIDLHWTTLDWFEPELARDDEICLEPLQERHLPAMLWQFRDPAIARRANLQPVDSRETMEDWWREQQQKENCYTYAVMHRDLGFSGVCGLTHVDDSAYFYFWMGTDCQGRGLGPRAAMLALIQMRSLGVQTLYTAVYPDNTQSCKALERAGFERLETSGRAADSEVLFYGCALTDQLELADDEEELQDLLDQLGAGFVVG